MSDKDEVRRFLPSVATVVRETDDTMAEQRRRQALENPDFQQAAVALKQGPSSLRPPRPGEAPLPYEVPTSSGGEKARGKKLPGWLVGVLAIVSVAAPVGLLVILAGPGRVPEKVEGAAVDAASSVVVKTSEPAASVSAVPSATVVESATPVVTATPRVASTGAAKIGGPKGKAVREDGPTTPKTAEPQEPSGPVPMFEREK